MAAAKRKAPPRCKLREGHAEDAHARADAMELEVARVGDLYSALLLEKGPRCQHSPVAPPTAAEYQTRLGELNRQLREALTDNTTLIDALTWKQREKLGL